MLGPTRGPRALAVDGMMKNGITTLRSWLGTTGVGGSSHSIDGLLSIMPKAAARRVPGRSSNIAVHLDFARNSGLRNSKYLAGHARVHNSTANNGTLSIMIRQTISSLLKCNF
jgi:hypothetical protein